MFDKDPSRIARWYFGGMASICAATFTHPLDLLKVLLQTPEAHAAGEATKAKASIVRTTVRIVQNQGITALYNGLTASWLRQLTYSTTRFGIYETSKQVLVGESGDASSIPFMKKVFLAGVSGAAGGFVGTPADMINVRMQNDVKLPLDQRRNYKNGIHGLMSVYREEGVRCLFNGATTATARAVLVTIGQLSMYDQYKFLLLTHMSAVFQDNLLTHFTSSLLAGATATTLTQPLDVMKTRMMNASPGEYKSIADCATSIFRTAGPIGFFKGYIPAFVRLAPHTILMFVFFEQFRMRFGYNRPEALIPPSV